MALIPLIQDRPPTGPANRAMTLTLTGDMFIQALPWSRRRQELTVEYIGITEDDFDQLEALLGGAQTTIGGYVCVAQPPSRQQFTPMVHAYGDAFPSDLKLWRATLKFWVVDDGS